MFPGGRPGVGLLLLRSALGGMLVLQGAIDFTDWHDLALLTRCVALLILASGALLVVGYLTPVASLIAGLNSLGGGLSWYAQPAPELFTAKLVIVLATVIAAAIVCLGPGAFSLDARLFGRREIVIPDVSRHASPPRD